jgi:beta-galactosidase
VGTYYRNDPLPVPLPQRPPGAASQLRILVEAMGRNNFAFGADLYQDPKGLVSNASLGGVPLANWEVQPLELGYGSLGCLRWQPAGAAAGAQAPGAFRPTFYRGWFNATGDGGSGGGSQPADTFLLMEGWDKGYVWVNGQNLGRYWQSQGPQRTLYVPGPWLRAGQPNEVVVLELSRAPAGGLAVESVAVPDFSGREVRA